MMKVDNSLDANMLCPTPCFQTDEISEFTKTEQTTNTFRNHLTPQNKVLVLIHVITGGIPEYQNFRTPQI